ncbi:hypothetical protein Zmor_022656 [Zophobas morio]|uniref:C2H2-type domain-containing protein n=1 Tax=Zophobas morio TaxID=2755281 RepID=A0AA38M5J4_9CUCU|nr:hypothetical protein Zmor_022656 [Zophobas morio]
MDPPKKVLIIPAPRLKTSHKSADLSEKIDCTVVPTNYQNDGTQKSASPDLFNTTKLVIDTLKPPFQAIHRPIIETQRFTTPQSNQFVTFYRCYFCPYRTQLSSSITDHLDLHKAPPKKLFSCEDTPLHTYKCPRCDLHSVMLFLAIEHLKLKHLEVEMQPTFPKSHICVWCKCETFSQIVLNEHSERHFRSGEVTVKKVRKYSRTKNPPQQVEQRVVVLMPLMQVPNLIFKNVAHAEKLPLRKLAPKIQTVTLPSVKLAAQKPETQQQSIVFQCKRCFYSAVNHYALIKQHLMIQHSPDTNKNQCVIFSYDVCTVDGRLMMRMNIHTMASFVRFKYFKCVVCPFQTVEWSQIKKHALNDDLHSFCEYTCEHTEYL